MPKLRDLALVSEPIALQASGQVYRLPVLHWNVIEPNVIVLYQSTDMVANIFFHPVNSSSE
jgi:hypothetical protein